MLESWFGDKNPSAPTVQRSPQAQSEVDNATRLLALYHYDTCWFCGQVRSAMERLGLNIELRNIHRDRTHHETLMREGGSGTVPCLRIEGEGGSVKWLYESSDIIAYLERRFA